MNKLHLCLIAAMALTACTEDDETLKGSGVIEGTIMPTEKPNDVITEGIFEKLNLDYPGLEKVKLTTRLVKIITHAMNCCSTIATVAT